MITLRQLLFFETLADTNHFGRAAEAVGVTQPALSTQIMELEARLGAKLVERNRGGITLTPMGKQVLPKARAILQQIGEVEALAAQDPKPLSGTLEVGMIPTIAPYLLPGLLAQLQSAYPSLDLKVRETVTERLIDDLQSGALTAVIAAKPIEAPNIVHIELFEDPFFIAAGTRDTHVLVSPVAHDALVLDRLLLLDDGHCLRDQALAVCAGAGQRHLVNLGATSMTTLLQLVANGMGVTLVPAIALAAETQRLSGITIKSFADPAPSRSVALFFRASSARTTDFDALAAVIRSTAQGLLSGIKPASVDAQQTKTQPSH